MEKNRFLLACAFKALTPDTASVLAGGEIINAWDKAIVHANQTIELEAQLPNLIDAVALYSQAMTEVSWRIGLYQIFEKCFNTCTYASTDDSIMIIEDGIEFFANAELITVTVDSKVVYKAAVTDETKIGDVADVVLKYLFEMK